MTADEQVERVALALSVASAPEYSDIWETSDEESRDVWRRSARAAIAAMTLTPQVVETAATHLCGESCRHRSDCGLHNAPACYEPGNDAMSDTHDCDPPPTPQADVLAEVEAQSLKDAADELDRLQSSHDIAECAGHVEGEVGRGEAIDNWISVCEDPQTWLRHRAGDALAPDAFVPLTIGTILCADGLHEECHDHESCQCGCHMTITPGAILDSHEAKS